MLKTTTETGDIGIFSIDPNIPPPARYHQQPRSRRGLREAGLQPPRQRDHNDRGGRDIAHDDRKRLPSYRDTTSEIISLYGSDTQPSYSGYLTPSVDDSRRSQSLTTCSSQALPSHRSCATIHSYSTSGEGYRPRSPFPYPTRLKRPSMRPCSPAMTDLGPAEHDQIAHWDHVSHPRQRTTKQGASLRHRHRPPMRLRQDANRSTSSLPTRASPGPFYDSYGVPRSRTPGSYSRPRRGSNEPSTRASSLTSIVEMYRAPTSSPASTRLRPMGSFYYDYSEGFERESPVAPFVQEPVCPIPQRSDSLARPLVLGEEVEEVLLTSPTQGPSSSSGRYSDDSAALRSSMCLPARESEDEKCPCASKEGSDLVEDEKLLTSDGQPISSQSLQHIEGETDFARKQTRTPDNKEIPIRLHGGTGPIISSGRDYGVLEVYQAALETPPSKVMVPEKQSLGIEEPPYLSNTWAGNKGGAKIPLNQRASTTSATKLRNSLDPALAEFASMYASFDRLARSPFSKMGDETYLSTSLEDARRGKRWRFVAKDRSGLSSGIGGKKSFGRIRKRAGLSKMSATKVEDVDVTATDENKAGEEETNQRKTPLQQFFSAHPLRAKASTPQLMKPLPPLPPEAYEKIDDNARVFVSKSSQSGVPRLRLRTKLADPPKDPVQPKTHDLESGIPAEVVTNSPRPKLRLKLSRAYLGLGTPSKSTTIVRSPGLKQCNALSEFQNCTRNDLFTPQLALRDTFIPLGARSVTSSCQTPDQKGEENRGAVSPQPSDQFDLPYPPTINVDPETLAASRHSGQQQESYHLESGSKKDRRLRQKISMLRLRITGGSRLGKTNASLHTTHLADLKSLSTPSIQHEDAASLIEHSRRGICLEKSEDDKGGRVKRWAHAMRLYVKKRLDRSPGDASH